MPNLDDIEKLLDRSHIPLPDKKVILFLIEELADKQSRGALIDELKDLQYRNNIDLSIYIPKRIKELESAPKPSKEKAEDE